MKLLKAEIKSKFMMVLERFRKYDMHCLRASIKKRISFLGSLGLEPFVQNRTMGHYNGKPDLHNCILVYTDFSDLIIG